LGGERSKKEKGEGRGGVVYRVPLHTTQVPQHFTLYIWRMKESDVESYLSEFDGVMRDIEKRGHNMVEVERAMFMLCGISEEWSFLRSQVFLQHGYERLTTEVIRTSLREYRVSLEFGKKRKEGRGKRKRRLGINSKCKV
jgi:hypothetical protein